MTVLYKKVYIKYNIKKQKYLCGIDEEFKNELESTYIYITLSSHLLQVKHTNRILISLFLDTKYYIDDST